MLPEQVCAADNTGGPRGRLAWALRHPLRCALRAATSAPAGAWRPLAHAARRRAAHAKLPRCLQGRGSGTVSEAHAPPSESRPRGRLPLNA